MIIRSELVITAACNFSSKTQPVIAKRLISLLSSSDVVLYQATPAYALVHIVHAVTYDRAKLTARGFVWLLRGWGDRGGEGTGCYHLIQFDQALSSLIKKV